MKPIKNVMEFYLPCLKCDSGKIKRTVNRIKCSDLRREVEVVKCDECNTEYIIRISPELKFEIEERGF